MGDGLKKTWGVGDPAKPGSDKQGQQFQAAFQKEMGVINGHLQYTSAHAETAAHDAFAARRDKLYPAFQAALAKIDRASPAKAQADIDKVVGDGKALCGEVATFRKAAEKAHKDWVTRQPKYDAAVRHVEELEAWGEARAAALRGLVDGIRTQVNERRYASASTTLDSLLPKLTPIYAEYVKQKDAKPKYEQLLAEQVARLEALKSAEQPSTPMTSKAGEADAAIQQAKTEAETKDFVAACEQVKAGKSVVDAVDQLTKDPQRAKHLAGRQAVEEPFAALSSSGFKSLETDWNAIGPLRDQIDPLAKSGDYAAANKLLADLTIKLAAFKTNVDALTKSRDMYQTLSNEVESQMQHASLCELPAVADAKATLVANYQAMRALADVENFAVAIGAAQALRAELVAFASACDAARIQIKAQISANLPAIQAEMNGLSSATSKIKDQIEGLITSISAAASGGDDAVLIKAAKDLAQLPELVRSLKEVEEIKKKMDAATTEEDKKKAAKKIVDEIATKGEIAQMPTEARNLLIEQLLKGAVSADNTATINKIWATPTLDQGFDAVDKPVRDKIIKAYAEDPKVVQYRKDWKTMTPDQKKEAVKYLTAIPCGKDGWNVGDPATFEFFDKPETAGGNILYGSYNHDSDKMRVNLNDDAHGRFDELLDTIAHEIGHKQQSVLIDQYRDSTLKAGDANYEEAKALALCDDYRIKHNAEFKKVYSTSPEETHSRVMGSELQDEMKKRFPPPGP